MTPQSVNNYLVPATGTTHAVPVAGVFSSTPTMADFRSVEISGQRFVPSGVFIDNSQGAGDLVISVQGMAGYTVVCPAGQRLQTQYPAPLDQIVQITGNGPAVCVFVDFPVIPFQVQGGTSSSVSVTAADGAIATVGATTDAPAPNVAATDTLMAHVKLHGTLLQALAGLARQYDADGDPLPDNFDSLPVAYGYDLGGDLVTLTVTDGATTWVKTYTWVAGQLTNVSAWVK